MKKTGNFSSKFLVVYIDHITCIEWSEIKGMFFLSLKKQTEKETQLEKHGNWHLITIF